jgi:hypothetical protein
MVEGMEGRGHANGEYITGYRFVNRSAPGLSFGGEAYRDRGDGWVSGAGRAVQ